MAIHVDVYADLNQRSVAQASSQLNTAFHDITVNVNVDANQATRSLRNFNKQAASTTDIIQELGTTAFKTSRGLATLGAPVAIAGLLEFAQVATAATQALWLLPAAASAAAAGIGTLAIATHGFGDTIKDMGDPKKFAEGIALLSPNAQQAALAIKSLVDGPLGELKKATQDNFFAGISDQLQNLSRIYVPEIRKMTTGIAGAFNDAMQGVGNLLATPAVQGQLSTTMANITTAFQNAAPAAQSFAQAFIDITEVGSSFLPGFGTSIANAADQFANFIREARESGKLATWIQQGIDAVKNLATTVSELVQIFYRVFGPDSTSDINNVNTGISTLDQTIQSYNADLTKTSDIIGLVMLDTHTWSVKWNEEMMAMQGPLGTLRDGILDIPEAFMTALNGVINGFNGFIDNLNKSMENSILAKILGGSPTIPHIPNVGSGGDWGGYQDTGPKPRARRNRAGQPIGPAPSTGPGPPGGSIFDVPPVPPDGAGGKQKDRRDAIIAGLDPAMWQVDPFGGMAGMQMGPGANPQDVLEQQRNVISEAHDLEEANKNLLALQQDDQATAQDLDEAKWKQVEEGWQLQEAQVKLAEKMAGTAKDVRAGSDELSAALDPDLGLGKGLAGLADNLVRFLGHLALAPIMAKGQQAINAQEAATGIKGGYGLLGMMGAQNLSKGLSPLLGQPMPMGGGTGAAPSGLAGILGAMGNPASTGGGYQSSYTPLGGQYPSATAAAGALPARSTGGYVGDAALLANVPAGQYTQSARGDLTKGLADCSSAVEDLVNLIQGQPTAGASMYTGNAAQWLTGRGFQQGMGGPGDMRVGFNSGHMQATLPGGTPFNWGGSASAARGGVGGTGADDPAFTSHFFLPMGGGPAGPATVGSGPLGTPLPAAPTRTGGGWFPSSGGGGGAAPLPFSGGGGQSPVLPTSPMNVGGGPGIGGGLGMNPTVPGGTGVGTRIGAAVAPYSNTGGGAGVGIAQGGPIDTAIQGAAAAADLFAPGSGQAIQMGMKLANRAIQYGGQVAGIGASGLMETFLPTGGSELANNNWLTRIAGGIASAAPAIPNLAGGKEGQQQQQGPLTPEQVAAGQRDPNLAGFQNAGPLVGNFTLNTVREPDRAMGDATWHLNQMRQSQGTAGRR